MMKDDLTKRNPNPNLIQMPHQPNTTPSSTPVQKQKPKSKAQAKTKPKKKINNPFENVIFF